MVICMLDSFLLPHNLLPLKLLPPKLLPPKLLPPSILKMQLVTSFKRCQSCVCTTQHLLLDLMMLEYKEHMEDQAVAENMFLPTNS